MKHYHDFAKQYFQHLEGIQFYPSFRNFWLWAWVFSTVLWFGALIQFAIVDHASNNSGAFTSILVTEVIWLIISFRVSAWKDKRVIDTTNHRFGASFISLSECRNHILCSVMDLQPPDFLKAAKEIDDLASLQRKFRKRSDSTLSELWRNIYDSDSKARLLTLIIALMSMTVVLAAKSNATLETVFDVYSEPESRHFLLFISFLAGVAFFAFIGLRIFVLTVIDGLASWSIKLFGGSVFTEWLLAYLVRDLINYHSQAILIPAEKKPSTG